MNIEPAENRPADFRRAASAPDTWAMFSWPLSTRFAVVVEFVTTLKVTFSGMPGALVLAPYGPHL